jgi:hypothetical protein
MKFINFLVALVAFPVILILLKLLWVFTIPEVFPGAVEQGLIVSVLSWKAAFKVALFIFVVGLFIRVRKSQ